MSKFEGTVEDIVFRNDQNGWTVAAIRLDGDRNRISAVGVMPFLSTGERAIFDGELTEHRDYGRQIKVASYEATRPETKSGVERFLGSGLIKGVGPATAKLIVDYFGARALDVLESEPERLIEVAGIGPKRDPDPCLGPMRLSYSDVNLQVTDIRSRSRSQRSR